MTSLNLIQLNFETGGYNLLARVIINGKHALLMIDTGAPKTVLDNDHFQKFVEQTELKRQPRKKLAPGATSIYSYTGKIDTLEIGSVIIRDYEISAVDLSAINRTFRGQGKPQIDGLLGCDLLHHCRATLKFKERVLEIDALEEPAEQAVNSVIE